MSSEIRTDLIKDKSNTKTLATLSSSAVTLHSDVVFPSDKVVKAWVKFSGGTQDIEDDYGISSRVDTATGNVLMNFDTAMSNTNYCIVASYAKSNDAYARVTRPGTTQSTTQFNLVSSYTTDSSQGATDPEAGTAIVFGDS